MRREADSGSEADDRVHGATQPSRDRRREHVAARNGVALDEAGLRHRLPSSSLSLGGLLRHLALAEDYYLTTKLRGEELVEPWRSLGHDDTDEWEFEADHFTAAQTYAVFDEAVVRNTARIEAALAEGGLDLVAHVDDGNGNHPRLRRLLVDLLEEYARHTGHADMIREAVDGRVGEDPPEDWTPPWLP